ncbi:MAG TPA: 2,3,4,5-tetrahydropyridine-2,6-dicarboxylate N-succinyltransferase, partial [Terriglobales bacterium]|nr:2,3,4,5-tetrahydropyridine-2,6-dicarboxylate N-succinyltransferase [Terriglobales bacterium]
MKELQAAIERFFAPSKEAHTQEARQAFLELREALTQGRVRAAEKKGDRWVVNAWVKQGILLGFRLGELMDMDNGGSLSFVDKDTFPLRRFRPGDNV